MSMINRIKRIHLRHRKRLIRIRNIQPVIHETGIARAGQLGVGFCCGNGEVGVRAADCDGHVGYEARGCVGVGAGFVGVIGGLRTEDYVRAGGEEEGCGVGDVGWECLDGFCYAAVTGKAVVSLLAILSLFLRAGAGEDLLVGGGAGFVAGARAVGAAVVGWCQAAAVVVAELDDHEVAGFDCVDQSLETAFAVVAAGGAAGYGVVDDWDGQGVVEVLAPS